MTTIRKIRSWTELMHCERSSPEFRELTFGDLRSAAIESLESYISLSHDQRALEIDLLLCHAFGLNRVSLVTDLGRQVFPDFTNPEFEQFVRLVERRHLREPIAYIIGAKEFYGRKFHVGPGVLIPRPETELVIDQALSFLKCENAGKVSVLDLGVGSGVLLVTLAAELQRTLGEHELVKAVGVDVSDEALCYARKNSKRLLPDVEMTYAQTDFTSAPQGSPLAEYLADELSIIVSNPPYVELDASLEPDVVLFEPHLALFAGRDPLHAVCEVIQRAQEIWSRSSSRSQILLVEFGFGQGDRVLETVRAVTGQRAPDLQLCRDLAGIERVVEVRWRR